MFSSIMRPMGSFKLLWRTTVMFSYIMRPMGSLKLLWRATVMFSISWDQWAVSNYVRIFCNIQISCDQWVGKWKFDWSKYVIGNSFFLSLTNNYRFSCNDRVGLFYIYNIVNTEQIYLRVDDCCYQVYMSEQLIPATNTSILCNFYIM
jgi:hypothetical protein